MDFLDPNLEQYANDHTSPESETLAELNRETHAKVMMPRMLSGHLQGRVLSLLSKLKQPKKILEIGTYTGYSAICLAEGLPPDGHLHTIDINEELEDMAQHYFEKAGMAEKITMHIGNALEIVPNLNEKWDLVFVDADKENYSNYFDLVIDRMNPGGLLIADNVLWSGKVLDPATNNDPDTAGLVAFNKKTHNDPRVENVLLPIRDGLMVVRKV